MTGVAGNMKITSSALSKVSRRLIEQRIFDKDKIKIEGDLNVTPEGTASAFGLNSFASGPSLSFSQENTVSIIFRGLGDKFQEGLCAWTMEPFSLYVSDEEIVLTKDQIPVCSISDVYLTSGDIVQIKVEITASTCYMYAVVGSNIHQKIELLSNRLSEISSVTIGTDKEESYWSGDIFLTDFIVRRNEEVYWTPSVSNYVKFNKVLIGDGVFPLSDKSEPILNHINDCPISEIQRNGNNIVVKCTLGAEVRQNIQEVGLYAETKEGPMLFAISPNLGVKKGSDLEYGLIIFIDINLNVVNTVVSPDIDVHKSEYISLEDFETIEKVHAYVVPNLERMIKTNALGIGSYVSPVMIDKKPVGVGYDEAQVLHRFQDSISLWEDSVSAIQGSAKVRHRFTPFSTYSFDESKLEKRGSILISPGGVASNFDDNSFVIVEGADSPKELEGFSTKIAFSVNYTSDDQSIVSFNRGNFESSMDLSIINKKCHFRVKELEYVEVKTGNLTNYFYRSSYSEESKYFWTPINDPSNTYSYYTQESHPGIGDIMCIEESGETLGTISKVSGDVLIDKDLFPVAAGRKYFILIDYKQDTYSVRYSLDNKNYRECFSALNNRKIRNYNNVSFGRGHESLEFFKGDIFLNDWFYNVTSYSEIGEPMSEIKMGLIKEKAYNKNILDHFHIPEYRHSFFKVMNLIDPSVNSYLEVFEGEMRGEKDNIDFKAPEGFSLCTKVLLGSAKDRVLLVKGNSYNEDYYFVLELKDRKLTFTLGLQEETIVLTEKASSATEGKFVDNAVTITIVRSASEFAPIYRMYRNNELIAEVAGTSSKFPDVIGYSLSNFLGDTPDYEELQDRTVLDILSFKGELDTNDIYYINNILDTNF